MPIPRGLHHSPDAIAAIHPLVREVLEGAEEGGNFCATYALEDAEDVWIQVTTDAINMAYPFADDPMARVVAAGVEGHERLTLSSWEPDVFATFDHDARASSRKTAALVDQLFLHVLQVPVVDGDEHPLSTEIFRLAEPPESSS